MVYSWIFCIESDKGLCLIFNLVFELRKMNLARDEFGQR